MSTKTTDTWFEEWCKQSTRGMDHSRNKYCAQQYPEWFNTLSSADQQLALQWEQNWKLDAIYDAVRKR
jgi:hypothetical protein